MNKIQLNKELISGKIKEQNPVKLTISNGINKKSINIFLSVKENSKIHINITEKEYKELEAKGELNPDAIYFITDMKPQSLNDMLIET